MIRGMKVMLVFELAELYKTETRQLKRQVRRNVERFPDDFLPPQVVELPSFGLRPTTYKSTHLISTLKNS
jgi:hypothetical protein